MRSVKGNLRQLRSDPDPSISVAEALVANISPMAVLKGYLFVNIVDIVISEDRVFAMLPPFLTVANNDCWNAQIRTLTNKGRRVADATNSIV